MLRVRRIVASARRVALAIGLATTFASHAGSTLTGGMTLNRGQSISSTGGQYTLLMQSDGNLVYYRNLDGSPRWNTATSDGSYSFMQQDGNFVLYTAAGIPRFNTGTQGNSGAYLLAQPDGNLVVYKQTGISLWSIGPDPLFQFSLTGPAPAMPTGTQSLGVSYFTGVTLRKSQGSLRYFTDIDSSLNVGTFYAANGTIIPYGYNFEIVRAAGGSDSNLYIIPDEVVDLTGIGGVSSGNSLFPAGADHNWTIRVRGLSYSDGGATGTASYKFVFRIYDTKCSIAKSGYPNDPSCLAYELPLTTTTVTWTSAAPPPPSGPPPVYPMVNNRPGDRNPPSALPTTSGWPVCSSNHPAGQDCECPSGGCQ